MPVWHEAVKKLGTDNNLVVLGVIQEQHSERCRLFAQWHKFDWPILRDPINKLGLRGIPIVIAIDEHGVVRDTKPRSDTIQSFVASKFDAPKNPPSATRRVKPDVLVLRSAAKRSKSFRDWRDLGDAEILWGDSQDLSEAVAAYQQAIKLAPQDAASHFRLGVAYRMRYESSLRENVDFANAVDHWGKALELDPNHYIYRRRLQQYGPRLVKPYPFYDWVQLAIRDVKSRGDIPVQLMVTPSGAEIAQPSRQFRSSQEAATSPDPKGQISRDVARSIHINSVVVPARVQRDSAARIHLSFRPTKNVHWNNEVEPLRVWIDSPQGWTIDKRLLDAPQATTPESREERSVEFELRVPSDASGDVNLNGYALYYVCEEVGGACLFLRQDFSVKVKLKE